VLLEAALLGAFFALAIPFGYLSRVFKQRIKGWAKWPAFLGLVHAPVVPLIVFVRVAHPEFEFEVALVAFLLLGHLTGVLAHRHLKPAIETAGAPAAVSKD
jgi:hypothetical protein